MIEEKYRLSGNKSLAFTTVSNLQINANDVFVEETLNTVSQQLSFINKKTNLLPVDIESGIIDVDLSLSNTFIVSMNQNVTDVSIQIDNPGKVSFCQLCIIQNNTTPYTFTCPASWKFPASLGAYVISSTLGSVDILELATYNDGSTWMVSYAKGFI